MTSEDSAAERKRKRLEAWKQRRQQEGASAPPPPPPPPPPPAVKVSLSLKVSSKLPAHKKKIVPPPPKPINPFGSIDDDEEDDDSDDEGGTSKRGKLSLGLGFSLTDDLDARDTEERPSKRRKGRWDNVPGEQAKLSEAGTKDKRESSTEPSTAVGDTLEKFMDKLQAGALGSVVTQVSEASGTELLSIDVGGSMMRVPKLKQAQPSPISGGTITQEQLAKLSATISKANATDPETYYTPSDWESDSQQGGSSEVSNENASLDLRRGKSFELLIDSNHNHSFSHIRQPETEDEEEEKARRAFIEALKNAAGPNEEKEEERPDQPILAAEVRSEKQRREQRLRELEKEAQEARHSAQTAAAPELGRLYNDIEGGVMEEAERNLESAMAAPDALQVIAELNKKKELKAVDHSKVDYIPFKKNLYIVPRSLAKLSSDEIADLRGKLKVKVRGHGAPAPVSSFEQCGLSERILQVMEKQKITTPFPIQAQCLPCIMAGRDVIGIAKTGSGKTLAYLLPMLRHIMDQPPLGPNESGPIGLVLAPARELAYQIHIVCKTFTKQLGLK